MATPQDNRERAYALLTEAEQQTLNNQFKPAYDNLQELIKISKDDLDLADYHRTAQSQLDQLTLKATRYIEQQKYAIEDGLKLQPSLDSVTDGMTSDDTGATEYAKWWNERVEEYISKWDQEILRYFSNWEQAIIIGQDLDYDAYTSRHIREQRSRRRALFEEGIRAEVDRLWGVAESLTSSARSVEPTTIMQYYENAREIVRASLDFDSVSPTLKALNDTAEKRRNDVALGMQVFTSAVQEEYYSQALSELETLPDDQPVPVYTFRENAAGQMVQSLDTYAPVSEAKKILGRLAAEWARKKGKDYLNNAEAFLARHQPNRAMEEVEQQAKIDDFLEPDDRKDFKQLKEKINKELKDWQRAEDRAKEIDELVNEPLAAWVVYEDAKKIYEWAEGVTTAKQTLISRIRSILQEEISAAKDAYAARDVQRVKEIYDQADTNFRDKDPLLAGLVDEIKTYYDNIIKFEKNLSDAVAEVNNIQSLLRDNEPRKAASQLTLLKNTYDDEVLKRLDNLQTVEDLVLKKGTAEDRLDSLNQALNYTQPVRIQTAIDNVKAAMADFPEDERFDVLLARLNLHKSFIEAQRQQKTSNYKTALTAYEALVQEDPDHPDADEARAQIKIITDLLDEQDAVNDKLNKAEAILDDNNADPSDAYLIVQNLEAVDQEQLRRRETLVNRAKSQYEALLEDEFVKTRQAIDELVKAEKIDVRQSSNLTKVIKERLKRIQQLGLNTQYNDWQQSFTPILEANKAQVLLANDAKLITNEDYGKAIQNYRDASKGAEGDERQAYLRELQKAQLGYGLSLLEKLEANITLTSDDAEASQIAIQEAQKYLGDLLEEYPRVYDIALWQARLSKIGGQSSFTPKDRLTYFEDMQRLSTYVEDRTEGGSDHHKEATKLRQEAQQGIKLAETLQSIERSVNRGNLDGLMAARDAWNEADTDNFPIVRRWWTNLTQKKLNDLYKQVGETGTDIHVEELRPLAMINVLDPDYRRAKRMISNIETYQRSVADIVDTLVKDEAQAMHHGFSESEPEERLQSQMTYMNSVIGNIDVLISLARTLNIRNSEVLSNNLRSKKTKLEETLRNLGTLKQTINAINAQVNLDQQEGNFTESQTLLAQVNPLYASHPTVLESRKVLRGLETRLKNLTDLRVNIVKAFKNEDYEEVRNLFSDAGGVAEFERFGLSSLREFNVTDPTGRERIRTIDDIAALVRTDDRLGAYETIAEFAALIDLQGQNGLPAILPANDPALLQRTKRAVNWETYKDNALDQVNHGDFEAAMTTVNQAMNAPIQNDEVPLDAILEHLSNPPFVETPPNHEIEAVIDAKSRYRLAITYAGSKRGQEILEAILETHYDGYINQMTEAKAMVTEEFDTTPDEKQFDNIYKRAWLFEDGWRQWMEAIHQLGAAVRNISNGGFNRRQAKLAIDAAHANFLRCEKACNDHPRLDEMRDNWLWKEYSDRVGTPIPQTGLV